MTIKEELESPAIHNQFMNDNFQANSSVVLNIDTALEEDYCTHRDLQNDFYKVV